MIRILIADDQELIRSGLRALLDRQPDLEVVGEAADGHGALALAAAVHPDVVLMDIRMPGLDGLAATKQLLAGPDTSVRVVLAPPSSSTSTSTPGSRPVPAASF